tara:strand:+ start:222 stop:587 length:366 start_codon:yes stop_codon:yes gene_type:complete
MPIYQFIHPETKEVIDVVQRMKQDHVFIDEHGVEWQRVWSVPQASIDTQVDHNDKNAWMRKMENKRLTVGDMEAQGEQLSQKRAKENGGVDPLRRKYFDDWSKKRKGKKHPRDPKGGGKIY